MVIFLCARVVMWAGIGKDNSNLSLFCVGLDICEGNAFDIRKKKFPFFPDLGILYSRF